MRRTRARAAFWTVVAVAALARGAGIANASFFHYDEGETAKSALGPAVAARWILRTAWEGGTWSREALRAEYERYGFPYARTSARPGYLALGAASMTLFGVSDTALIGVSAAAGVGTVAWIFLILRRLWPDTDAAFWGALALAVSPAHVFFSRTGFAHVTAAFFLAWAVFLYLEAEARGGGARYAKAGLAAGYAFTCHFNVATALAVLALFHVGRRAWIGERTLAGLGARDVCLAGLAAAAPPLAFQALTAGAAAAFPAWLPDQTTYFEDLAAQRAHLFAYCNPRARSTPLYYGLFWLRAETAGLLAGAVVGTVLAWRRGAGGARDAGGPRLAAALVWWPFVAMSAMRWKVARTLVPLLPFASVLWGAVWGSLRPAGRAGWWMTRSAAVALLAVPAACNVPLWNGHGHFRDLVAALKAEGRAVVGVDEFPVLDFYAGHPGAFLARDAAAFRAWQASHPGTPATLVALCKDGVYGFEDPVYANRFGFVRDVIARRGAPDRALPFRVPVVYEHVDETFRPDRLFRLSGLRYEVHLFDLEGRSW